MEEFKYERKVAYYETDMLGVVHHSNYIRWFEEARVKHLDEIGLPYKMLEDKGIAIPVLGVNCEYKRSVTFADVVEIKVTYKEFTGVRMSVEYVVTNKATGDLVATGETKHCFTDKNVRPITLKKVNPEIYERFMQIIG